VLFQVPVRFFYEPMHIRKMQIPMRVLIATQNQHKLDEFRQLITGLPLTLVSPAEIGLSDFDVEEIGQTLQANAELKATAFAKASGLYSLADDTGLLVDALDGRPGVYSARYGGPGLSHAQRRAKLLDELNGVPDEQRTARFECVIAVADPAALECRTVTGVVHGRIIHEDRGSGGFGYDALFLPDGHTRTFAEMSDAEKGAVSHRGVAARLILPVLREIAGQS
jgi:XTP/dITP diphosphohydrolase